MRSLVVTEVREALSLAAAQASKRGSFGCVLQSCLEGLIGDFVAALETGDQALCAAYPRTKPVVTGALATHPGQAGVRHGGIGIAEVEDGIRQDAAQVASYQVQVLLLGLAPLREGMGHPSPKVSNLAENVRGCGGGVFQREPAGVGLELLQDHRVKAVLSDLAHECER